MTITHATFDGINGIGKLCMIAVTQNAGENFQWRIEDLTRNDAPTLMHSTSLGAPSYGYYPTVKHAMRSAKRILKTLAQ